MITTVEEAVRLGADAVSIGIIIGSTRQAEQISQAGVFVREARMMGMPTVAHIYPRGELIPEEEHTSMEQVRYAVRVGAEIGIDIIKTLYTGSAESFSKVVEACPAYVVAAGGVEASDGRSFLNKAKEVVDAGGAGLACGRFVWNYTNTPALVCALKHIIHEDGTVAEACKLLED